VNFGVFDSLFGALAVVEVELVDGPAEGADGGVVGETATADGGGVLDVAEGEVGGVAPFFRFPAEWGDAVVGLPFEIVEGAGLAVDADPEDAGGVLFGETADPAEFEGEWAAGGGDVV